MWAGINFVIKRVEEVKNKEIEELKSKINKLVNP